MRDIGSANVQGTLYDLLSPRVVGDYIENIGAACQNPDGYAANKIFVAYDSSMNQHLYKTTAQITQGTQITSSNCEQTSLSELLSGSGSSSSLEDLSDTDISSKTAGDIVEYNNSTGKWENTQKLVNLEKSIAPVEDGATLSQAYAIGEKFIRGGVRYKAKTDLASGTQFSSLIINTNYEAADDVSSEIQTLTNQVKDMNNILGAKNLLPNQALDDTWNGITWKVNSDGTLSASGTATANSIRTIVEAFEIPVGKYILNGCPSGSGYSTYYLNFSVESGTVTPNGGNDIGEGLAFEVTQTAKIVVKARVLSGQTVNIAFKPMIRLASITDDTYVPYAKTNRELTEDTTGLLDNLEVNGAVNMLNHGFTTQTKNGITFTVNDDGTVTANGTSTASGNTDLDFDITLPKGTYKMSGCPSGGSNTTYRQLLNIGKLNTKYAFDYGDGAVFTLTEETTSKFYVTVASGATVSNLTFKPMITLASYNGDYVPYAKSNKELTEELTVESGEITRLVSFSSLTAYIARKYGKVVELQFTGTLNEAVNTWTDFLTVPEGFRPSHYVQFASFKTYNSCYNLQLSPAGGIQSGISFASGDQVRFTVTYIID